MEGRSLLMRIGMVLLPLALCLGLTGLGEAQEKYPTREITLISGTQAGTINDLLQRVLFDEASKILGQNIIVVNKPGAAHGITFVAVKNAKPDGYTIGYLPSAGVAPQLMRKVPYDMLKDFEYIIQCFDFQQAMAVQTGAPWKTMQELVEYALKNPGKVRMGVMGVGGSQHLAMERLQMKIGVKFIITPFGNAVDEVTGLLGGHIDAAFCDTTLQPHVDSGELRLLAVGGAGDKRLARYSKLPTLMELYGIEVPTFSSFGGPKGLPPHVVDTLHKALKKAMENPEFINIADKANSPILYRGPEDTTKEVHETFQEIGDIVKKLGLQRKE